MPYYFGQRMIVSYIVGVFVEYNSSFHEKCKTKNMDASMASVVGEKEKIYQGRDTRCGGGK